MTLAEQVLAEYRSLCGNPEFAHLSGEMLALCIVLELREQIAAQNRAAASAPLPARYAEGVEPRITARPRRR